MLGETRIVERRSSGWQKEGSLGMGAVRRGDVSGVKNDECCTYRSCWLTSSARSRLTLLLSTPLAQRLLLLAEMQMVLESRARDAEAGVDKTACIVDRNQFFNTQVM